MSTDVGWHRRYRGTDLAAAVCFGLAVPAFVNLGYPSGCLAVALGLLLTLAHRDRRIERVGGEVWLVDEWWLLGSRRSRRQLVQPGRVVLTVPETGWAARRHTVLTVDGPSGPLIVDGWRQVSERDYALPLAAGLARWFDVRLSGTLAPFDGRADGPTLWASLRTSLEESRRDGAPSIAHRAVGRRPGWQIALHVFLAVEGVALLAVSAFAPRAQGINAFALGAALPIGALLASYGLRGFLTGKIVTVIGPYGLHVERGGSRQELIIHLPFAAVTWVGVPAVKRSQPALRIGCGDAFVDLTARMVGVGAREFSQICDGLRRALADWLDSQLAGGAVASAGGEPAPAAPAGPVFLDDGRMAPGSAVAVLAQAFPYLAILGSLAFLAAAYLLNQAFAHGPALVPANVRLVFPSALVFLGLKAVAAGIGVAASAAITALAVYLFWCSPRVPGQVLFSLPIVAFSLLPVFTGGIYGPLAVDCLDICGGAAQPARLPLTVYRDALQYGPYNFVAPGSRRPDERDGWFRPVSEEKELLDVEGLLGGRYLVVSRAYHGTCDAWQARLPAALKREVVR